MAEQRTKLIPGPAVFSGPTNRFDQILDDLVGVPICVCLIAPSGEMVDVTGVNHGTHIATGDGMVYPYTTYKVSDIY